MKEYEIIIETINPCGGDRHSQQEIVEAKIESPEAFVKEKGRFPIIDKIENPDGGVVIVTHVYLARRIIFQLCFAKTASSFPPSSFEHSALAFTGTTFSG